MIYNFPYWQAGFHDEEWEDMPCGHKRIIRDFYLNSMEETSTILYDFFDTDFSIRRTVKRYGLNDREKVPVSVADFNFHSMRN